MYNEMHVRFISKLENVTLARSLSVAFLVDLNLNLKAAVFGSFHGIDDHILPVTT